MGRRCSGGVSMVLMSRTPTSDMCRVRGMGVALRVKTSTSWRIFFRCSLCLTPKRCSSSMIKRPRFLKAMSFCNSLCVPMQMSMLPLANPATMACCSFVVLKRLKDSMRTGKASSLSLKVEKCCWASTVVGTSTATCFPSITALKAARMATSVLP